MVNVKLLLWMFTREQQQILPWQQWMDDVKGQRWIAGHA
jgi:hypothetical protein